MPRSKYNLTTLGVRGQAFVVGVRQRQKRFVDFPLGSSVTWNWNDDPLGVVSSYDHDRGRILTDRGGSHNPEDIKVVTLPQTEK